MNSLLQKLASAFLVVVLLLSAMTGPVSITSPALADDDGGDDGGDDGDGDGDGDGHDGGDGGDDGHDGGGEGDAGDDDGGGHAGSGDGGRDYDDEGDDHEEAYARRQRGEITALAGVLRQLKKRYGGRILDVKLKKRGRQLYYRIKLLDRTGHVRKITVAARPAVRTNFTSRKRPGR